MNRHLALATLLLLATSALARDTEVAGHRNVKTLDTVNGSSETTSIRPLVSANLSTAGSKVPKLPSVIMDSTGTNGKLTKVRRLKYSKGKTSRMNRKGNVIKSSHHKKNDHRGTMQPG